PGTASLSAANGFQLTNIPGPPASVTINANTSPQSAQVTKAFATPLAVTVKDAQGNLVANTVQVTFTATTVSGATGTFATSATVNTVSGIATAPAFTAGTVAGGPYT